jgi:hypothetical protein
MDMCQTVVDTDNKAIIGQIGELAELVGGVDNIEGMEFDEAGEPIPVPLDGCLCGYDLASTLVHAGYVVWQPPNGDSMGYYFRRQA